MADSGFLAPPVQSGSGTEWVHDEGRGGGGLLTGQGGPAGDGQPVVVQGLGEPLRLLQQQAPGEQRRGQGSPCSGLIRRSGGVRGRPAVV